MKIKIYKVDNGLLHYLKQGRLHYLCGTWGKDTLAKKGDTTRVCNKCHKIYWKGRI